MSTSILQSPTPANPAARGVAPAKPAGVWSRIISCIMAAREAQAKREVARYLSQRPDRYLRDIGLTETEITELRHQQRLP